LDRSGQSGILFLEYSENKGMSIRYLQNIEKLPYDIMHNDEKPGNKRGILNRENIWIFFWKKTAMTDGF